MAPVSVAGTLTQVLAEAMAGIAYAQLVNPGAPVIFGAFVTSIDMNSGAPTFGTPEASKILWGAGQLARRLNLPFRSGGALCGSKLPDAQAAYESANTLQAALLGGVNFMLHACGWLEGGLVSSYEKFVLDADQLGVLHSLAEGIDLSENGQAMDAIARGGAGRALPRLRAHPGELQDRVLAHARCSTTGRSRPGPRRAGTIRWRSPTRGCGEAARASTRRRDDPDRRGAGDFVERRKASEPDASAASRRGRAPSRSAGCRRRFALEPMAGRGRGLAGCRRPRGRARRGTRRRGRGRAGGRRSGPGRP